MSERTLRQLVGAFAILAGAWVVLTLVDRGSGSIEATGEVARLFTDLTPAGIESATFETADGEVRLERGEDGWTVNGFDADVTVASRFAASLSDLRVGDLTASNPANHDRMGVSTDSAVTVTLRADGRDRTFLVGRAGRRFGTAYLRLPDSDDVYLLEGDLRSHAVRPVDQWRNRTMVQADTALIAEIEVLGAGAGYTLVRADSAWMFEGGPDADPTAVRGILTELSNLTATGFVADTDSLAALPEARTTTVRTAEGEVVATVTLGEGTGDRWARVEGDEVRYRVSSFRAGRVAPSREEVTPGS